MLVAFPIEKAGKLSCAVPLQRPSGAAHNPLLLLPAPCAQTTDKKVNECTPALFQLAPDAAAMAAAEQADIQACIRSLGLAPTKAKNLKAMSQLLVEQHGGQVPASLAELELLPGVGHKTASVVMCQAFGQAAFPVDTHIHVRRVCQRGCSACSVGRGCERLLWPTWSSGATHRYPCLSDCWPAVRSAFVVTSHCAVWSRQCPGWWVKQRMPVLMLPVSPRVCAWCSGWPSDGA